MKELVQKIPLFCGGETSTQTLSKCWYYYYNDYIGKHRWYDIIYEQDSEVIEKDGVVDTEIEVWNFESGVEGFLQVGGRFGNEQNPTLSKIYTFSPKYGFIMQENPFTFLSSPMFGHCFVRVRSSFHQYVYLAISGKAKNNFHLSFYFCNSDVYK